MIKPDANELIPWRGVVIDRRTAALICVVERELGYELSIVKAHEEGGSNVSSTTHTGLGVVDLPPYDWQNKLKALKKYAAAHYRTSDQGPWSPHIHFCSLHTGGMDPLARSQVASYLATPPRDGLAGNALDPRPWRHPEQQVFNFDAYWHDQLLDQRITGLRARLKKTAERISALRTRRKTLKAQIAAAKDQKTYLH